MNHTEERIVQLLKAQPLTAQEVADKISLNANYIRSTLKNMEVKGRIASSAMSGSRKYSVRTTTADEMSRRRAAIKQAVRHSSDFDLKVRFSHYFWSQYHVL